MQKPLAPAESMKHLALPRGLRGPALRRRARHRQADLHGLGPPGPALDRRERSTIPTTSRHEGQGNDRIKICEDTDGDGTADKFTVFAEGLNIPTSLAFADGGVVVHQAPDTLFLKDTDGDDKADVRKVLFTGWGTRDTHAGPSNLRYGFDNWLYGIVGYSGVQGGRSAASASRSARASIRFKPDGSKLEFLRSTNNNSWGVGFSEEGLVFGSTANGCPSVFLPIPNRYYESVRGGSAAGAGEHRRLQPLLPGHRQGPPGRLARRVHRRRPAMRSTPPGRIPSTTGTARRSSASRPGTWSPRSRSSRKGSDFAAHNGWNLLASDDEWTAPDRGRGRPRRQRLGDRLVQLHRPAQPDARRVSRPARATPT